jgi:hypothetical protein
LRISSVIHRELKAVCHVQRFAPSLDASLVICRDVQERKINKSGTSKVRIYTASPHGNCETVGDLKPPECRHNGAGAIAECW